MLGLRPAQPEDLSLDGSVNVSIDTYAWIAYKAPLYDKVMDTIVDAL